MNPLTKTQIRDFLAQHENWQMDENTLIGGFSFNSFAEVKQFVELIMVTAEKLNHHPTVSFGYNFVRVETTTHDAGEQVTEQDLKFADSISAFM